MRGDDVPLEVQLDEKEVNLHKLDSLSLLLYVALLTATVLTVWMFKHRRIRYLHETGLALFYGLVIGLAIRYGITDFGEQTFMTVKPANHSEMINGIQNGPPDILKLTVQGVHNKTKITWNKTLAYSFKGEVSEKSDDIDQKATFDPEIFFNILLPPIIFHAGYSMKKRFFFRNLGAILTYAFVGTTLSTFTVAGIMYGVTQLFEHLAKSFTFLDSLRFGALISATDPVTILAIFTDLHVDVNLYAIVFGESVLNDAVSMVLTRTLEDYEESLQSNDEPTPTYITIFRVLGEFLGIFLGSFFLGAMFGCLTAALTKFTQIKQHPQLECTLFVLMSYASFLTAETFQLTGIVAVLSCGICQAHYTYNNLSDESRLVTKQFFGLLNFMAENFIFCYVGVSMFTFTKHHFDPAFIFGSFFAIICGRAVNIYPLSFLLNLGRKSKITWNLQHMMFLSGLRGAIAFALAIRNTLTDARQMILTSTLVIVMVTVVVCGGSTVSLLTWFNIPIGVEDDDEDNKSAPLSANATPNHTYNSMQTGGSIEATIPPGNIPADKSIAAKAWSGFDAKYMKPLLTHSNPTLMETLPDCCGTRIGRMLTSKDQLARHPRMVNSSEEDTQSPVFDRDIANANANADIANEIITVEHNKRGFDAIPQPQENLS